LNRSFSTRIPKVPPKGFVVIDTETNGSSANSRVIEIGMIFLSSRGTQQKTFSTLLFGDGTTGEWYVKRVHHIKRFELNGAPRFKDIAPGFIESLTGRVVFSHNANFDLRRVNHELKLIRRKQLKNMACTLELGDFLGYGRLSLTKAVEKFDLFQQISHHALYDAFVASQLLQHYLAVNPLGVCEYLVQKGILE